MQVDIIGNIKNKVNLDLSDYKFLQENKHLGENIILLGLGGSYAYGTNIDGKSDTDLRGCTLNLKEEILTNKNFEQFIDNQTDTVIFAFNKFIKLLSDINPNCIEILGLKQEHYLFVSAIGQELLDNYELFLSRRAIYTFGSYASSMLHKLTNKAVRLVGQAEREQHILNSINNAYYTFPEKYFSFPKDSIKLYIDKSHQEDFDTEIYMDISLRHYPLRDYKSMWSEMNNIVKDYSKIGKRNKHAVEHGKLGKHMMHLVRLYYMCFDILENEKIITYREKEHDLLIDIRNGKYLDENKQPIPEFFEMVDELEKRLKYDAENTSLPDSPDYKKINEFVMSVNERVVKGEI